MSSVLLLNTLLLGSITISSGKRLVHIRGKNVVQLDDTTDSAGLDAKSLDIEGNAECSMPETKGLKCDPSKSKGKTACINTGTLQCYDLQANGECQAWTHPCEAAEAQEIGESENLEPEDLPEPEENEVEPDNLATEDSSPDLPDEVEDLQPKPPALKPKVQNPEVNSTESAAQTAERMCKELIGDPFASNKDKGECNKASSSKKKKTKSWQEFTQGIMTAMSVSGTFPEGYKCTVGYMCKDNEGKSSGPVKTKTLCPMHTTAYYMCMSIPVSE
jgi:hypothetical protein